MPIKKGRAGLQRCRVRKDGWTEKRRAIFLEVLAHSCNVAAASRAAGMGHRSARQLKLRDGEFALLYDQAWAAGCERLEEELMAHVLGGVSTGENPDGDLPEAPPVPFDPKLALEVLKLRGGFDGNRVRRRKTPPTQGEVDVALMARLEELAQRMATR